MSDSISGVIIPLIIPVDAPASLASGVQALAASLESTEFSNACLQLQQSFCYLTWHFADYSARHLQHLGLPYVSCTPFGHARLGQHLEALQKNLDSLAQAAEQSPEAGDVFRVFYVGGLRARQSSPRRPTRLLGLGGQSIRGYRSILEWCKLEVGEDEFAGELRCQRELRRYLPILREWLDSSSGHFRQIKGMEWYGNAESVQSTDTAPAAPVVVAPSTATESLLGLKAEGPPTLLPAPLTNFPTPPLFWRHQALYEEEIAAHKNSAAQTLGRLCGLAVQYLFGISAAALRSIGRLDPALEKRLETGLTLRQKQTSLTFLFKALAQHQSESPLLEQVARAVQAPTTGKLGNWLTSTWGGGHTFAEFCLESAKPEAPQLWQERFLPGIRIWLQQMASWFAQSEHYFQSPNEQGFLGLTIQVGDEHLEADRKALQIDTAALRISLADLTQLLAPIRPEESSGNVRATTTEPPTIQPEPEPVAVEPEPAVAELEPVAVDSEPVVAEPEPVAVEPEAIVTTAVAIVESESAAAEVAAELEYTPQIAAEQEWAGPDFALQLWDESVQAREPGPLLQLVSFLLQYTSGLAAEWLELDEKRAPSSLSEALHLVRKRLLEPGDTEVLLALGSPEQADSLANWLCSEPFQQWLLSQRGYRSDIHSRLDQWLNALQPFFKDSEQLFEEPSAQGKLEGVVVYQDRYLEFVDHPIFVGDMTAPYWQVETADSLATASADTADLSPVALIATEIPASDDDFTFAELPETSDESTITELTASATLDSASQFSGPATDPVDPDFSVLPACVTEYFGDLWPPQGASPEGLAAGLEFCIQYFAGLLTCVGIQHASLEASHLQAWRSGSNLLQRQEMLHQVLDLTKDGDHATLQALRRIFSDSSFAPLWEKEWEELASLAFALRSGQVEETTHASHILHAWIEASRELMGTLENLAEPIDAKGHLEVVVQQEDDFFELVEPEYAIHLVPPGHANWQDLIVYRNLGAKFGSQELTGSSEGSLELSGGAIPSDDSDDFFGSSTDNAQMMDTLFSPPEPVKVLRPEAPKPRPKLVQQEEETVAQPVRTDLQLNAVLEKLLQSPEKEAEPAAHPDPAAAPPEPAKAEKAETKAPARLDAPVSQPTVAEFIVIDPPILDYTIHYLSKDGQTHHGKIDIKNSGGSLLKGTVKSNHPCLRVNPSVFRSNEAEIEYWIDDSDRPSNMQKIGLSFHYSGQKLELPMEKLLPDKKFKQLATKMLGFVKNLRQKN
ncbi:hypothetical protein IV102_20295 [bacterium]|nr:hypothetical protein [bacterium]